jgi:protein-S-isoprenylcysteine O-methyltransferase Ste14
MNKIKFSITAIICLNLIPLLGKPELLLHYKTIILVIAAACLWLSQPAFSSKDTKEHADSDKKSVLIILIMSSLSVIFSVVEWAYATDQTGSAFWLTSLGLIMMTSGIAIRIWAINTLGKHFTATVTLTDNHQFISSGPYRLVRHPSYLGAFMAIVGCPIFLNAIWATLFSFIFMTIAYVIRITVEEKMLTSYFGKSYEKYKCKTKMIIPFIW